MRPRTDEAFALEQDQADPLRAFRDEFHVPAAADVGGEGAGPALYFVGNSLGLMPRATRAALAQELDDWARFGVEGHFHAKHPWYPYHEALRAGLAHVVGATEREVVAMNSLTVNLHLLMVSFYRPTRERYKIVIEDTAFPSDSYAVLSQLDFHARALGFDPARGLIRLKPRAGEASIRTDDILAAIDREHATIALVMLGGVNYLTGQLFDLRAITTFTRERGIAVGWDLAHAAGNVSLRLHEDGPDFAAWCSYKYLNSGPGALAGAFVHERHLGDATFPRFAGWWGNDPATRFTMTPDFIPSATADAWSLSNPPILAACPLRVSLDIFTRASMPALRAKSLRLTAYLESLLADLNARPGHARVGVLTPTDPAQRGCQLSLLLPGDARAAHKALQRRGVVADYREPSVVRVAPVPLYNTFHDVWRFASILGEVV
ncbi:MAG: kynureninase [Phycisphaerae bacterium]|nr:MAG: kynureninase [Phycisphaerae bacterium]